MIRKSMYEVRAFKADLGPGGYERNLGVSGPFETRNTAERAAIAFAQSGQCSRTEIHAIIVEESEVCEHPTSERCPKCTTPRDRSIPEPLTGVPQQKAEL